MPRSLITGGAGFLGSHLCERLLREGHDVVCLDNLLTGDLRNIRHLLKHSRFVFLEKDVTEPIQIDQPLDYVLHLASPASPKDYLEHPVFTSKAGAIGSYQCLELAKSMKSVFLLTSTSEVYGDPEVSPQTEGYWGHVNPIGPRSTYDEAKRFAESLTMAFHREYKVDVRISRIFNTYGPRMRQGDGRVVPNFITQALKAEPLTVYGDGSQTRSFCYVDDLIEGLYRLLTADPRTCVDESTRIINLGNPEEQTVLDLARQIIELTNSSSRIEFQALPEDDPRQRCPDISRAKAILNWTPRTSIREGLAQTVAYFRSESKVASA